MDMTNRDNKVNSTLASQKKTVKMYWESLVEQGSVVDEDSFIPAAFEWIGLYKGQILTDISRADSWVRPEEAKPVMQVWYREWLFSKSVKMEKKSSQNAKICEFYALLISMEDDLRDSILPLSEYLGTAGEDGVLIDALEKAQKAIEDHLNCFRLEVRKISESEG